jgi:hypothetical protein
MRRIGFGLIMALGVVSAGCNKSDPVDPTVPFKMVMLDGEPQSGTSGTDAEAPLRVQVQNSEGDGVSGVTVLWTVTSGGGSVSDASQETNSQGISSITFTYGDPGEQIITATIPGLTGSPQTFNLTSASAGGGGGGGGL